MILGSRNKKPAITAYNVWNKLGSCRARTGKDNMPNIGTSLHFLITNKVSSFLVWFKKSSSNLAMEKRGYSQMR